MSAAGDRRRARAQTFETFDTVIVGAGASGALMAARLAEAGLTVLMLEAGPAWTLDDLKSSQIWSRRLKWGAAPIEFVGEHRAFAHNLGTGWGTGGAALHHFATWPRMGEEVFGVNSRYGRGIDWPIAYADLRPWYDKVQAEVGVSGDASREPWHPPADPYPQPALPTFTQGKLLEAGFAKLGLATAPLPAGILTRDMGERQACQYDGWCEAGCPIGALANPLVTHLPLAEAAGARLRNGASVIRLLPGSNGRAAGIEYADTVGERHRVRAGTIVLAASAVQNPRILFNSACEAWPDGPGNRADLLGRYFMLDALTPVFGMFEEETLNYQGVPAGQLMHRSVYRERAGGPFGSYQWQIASSMKPNDMFGIAISRADIMGEELHEFIQRGAKHLAFMGALCEQLPDAKNRVTLSEQRDGFGVPVALVSHNFDQELLALIDHCSSEGLAIMRAAGAVEQWTGPMGAGHISGGTIMGDDARSSVTDSFGRLHEVDNVYLTGAGLFPTTGAVSPTFTLLALAERTAARILETRAA